MIDQLVVLHHREDGKSKAFQGLDASSWVPWRTCLRHMAIGFPDEGAALKVSRQDQFFMGEEAYRFFLEVVCGLHSPVVGETEIMGQFKELMEQKLAGAFQHSYDLQKFFTWILADAKTVRQNHLRDLGSRSYGSLLRRYVRGTEALNFVGAGKLVKEILPWLVDKVETVNVFCRRAEQGEELKREFPKIRVRALSELEGRDDAAGVIVIAAPIEREKLETWISANKNINHVVDLRHSAHVDELQTPVPVLKLHELFDELETHRRESEAKVAQAKELVASLAAKRFKNVEIRPLGWEDLCG